MTEKEHLAQGLTDAGCGKEVIDGICSLYQAGNMEFCQLQLNYLDWTFQHGKEKVDLLNEWRIPVWVMEPLRGGKLARLSPEYEKELKALAPTKKSPPGLSASCKTSPTPLSFCPVCPIRSSWKRT